MAPSPTGTEVRSQDGQLAEHGHRRAHVRAAVQPARRAPPAWSTWAGRKAGWWSQPHPPPRTGRRDRSRRPAPATTRLGVRSRTAMTTRSGHDLVTCTLCDLPDGLHAHRDLRRAHVDHRRARRNGGRRPGSPTLGTRCVPMTADRPHREQPGSEKYPDHDGDARRPPARPEERHSAMTSPAKRLLRARPLPRPGPPAAGAGTLVPADKWHSSARPPWTVAFGWDEPRCSSRAHRTRPFEPSRPVSNPPGPFKPCSPVEPSRPLEPFGAALSSIRRHQLGAELCDVARAHGEHDVAGFGDLGDHRRPPARRLARNGPARRAPRPRPACPSRRARDLRGRRTRLARSPRRRAPARRRTRRRRSGPAEQVRLEQRR